MNGQTVGRVFLALLGLRLLAWAFLLPPWSGYDEAYHHAYILDVREQLVWPEIGEFTLGEEIAEIALVESRRRDHLSWKEEK